MMIKCMGIDPSSRKIGVALINEQGKLLEGTLIKPDNKNDGVILRMTDMSMDISLILRDWQPDYIAIEIPAIHKAGRIKKAQGLATYGFGAGVVWYITYEWVMKHLHEAKLKHYDAQEWTGGKKKKDRAAELALRRPEYKAVMDAKKDPDYDVADAIQLAELCLKDVQIESRMPKSGTIQEPVR